MNGDNPQPPDQNQAQSPWQYHPDAPASPQAAPVPVAGYELAGQPSVAQQNISANQEMTWSASEFIAHEKGVRWYGLFGLAVLAVTVLVYLMTHDVFSVIVILGIAGLAAYSAGRRPQIVTYRLDSHGLTIGNKHRLYSEFHSFGIVQEGAFSTIVLAPLKRLAVPLTLYYEPKDEDEIVAIISQHLPVEQRDHDAIDKLTRRIRF